MGLARGLIAFLEAVAEPGQQPGQGADTGRPAPPSPPEPLGKLLEAHAVRIASLEASLESVKSIVREEADRAERAAERTRRAVQRALERAEGSLDGDPGDAAGGLPEHDAAPSGGGRVPAVYRDVEGAGDDQAREQWEAAVRRQIAFS